MEGMEILDISQRLPNELVRENEGGVSRRQRLSTITT